MSKNSVQPVFHGGDIYGASAQYGIPVGDWLDLSTGINPNGWQVPVLPETIWQRLPDGDPALELAAKHYYGCESLVAVPGSQFAIQTIPTLRAQGGVAGRVALPQSGYAEHRAAWAAAGHQLWCYNEAQPEILEQAIAQGEVDTVVVINPNNPTGQLFAKERLLEWRQGLAARDGLLLVDEAFMDSEPQQSLAGSVGQPGLVVLRSVGKFFGLAGIRLGFVLAAPDFCAAISRQLGPWAINHPARWIGARALADKEWQQQMREQLWQASRDLRDCLAEQLPGNYGASPLFVSVVMAAGKVQQVQQQLARQGIWVRSFNDTSAFTGLRFGLPKNSAEWQRLKNGLARLT